MSKMVLYGWEKIALVSSGAEYGHVPGHHFHDVDVVVSRRGGVFRVAIQETAGNSQGRGCDQVHLDRRVFARAADFNTALDAAERQARGADFDAGHLVLAISEARDEVAEAMLVN
jgi:hypothetical protein